MDCRFFTGRGDSDKQRTITALVMLDRASGDMTSTVTDKDVVVHMSQVLRASLWEHVHVTMRHDTNFQRQTLFTNVRGICGASHQSGGAIGRANQEVACEGRDLKLSVVCFSSNTSGIQTWVQ